MSSNRMWSQNRSVSMDNASPPPSPRSPTGDGTIRETNEEEGIPRNFGGSGSGSSRFLSVERNSRMVHQKSSESQDSTASAVSMMSIEEGSAAAIAGPSSTKIELINNKRSGTTDTKESVTDIDVPSKTIWKRAVQSLRRDKSGKRTPSLKKKESKTPVVPEPTKEEMDIDPVYNLLKCAAVKGQAPPYSGSTSPASGKQRSVSMPNKRMTIGLQMQLHQVQRDRIKSEATPPIPTSPVSPGMSRQRTGSVTSNKSTATVTTSNSNSALAKQAHHK